MSPEASPQGVEISARIHWRRLRREYFRKGKCLAKHHYLAIPLCFSPVCGSEWGRGALRAGWDVLFRWPGRARGAGPLRSSPLADGPLPATSTSGARPVVARGLPSKRTWRPVPRRAWPLVSCIICLPANPHLPVPTKSHLERCFWAPRFDCIRHTRDKPVNHHSRTRKFGALWIGMAMARKHS